MRPDRDRGYVHPSVQALDAYWARLTGFYGDENVTPHVLNVDGVPLQSLAEAEQPNVKAWVDSILSAMSTAPVV